MLQKMVKMPKHRMFFTADEKSCDDVMCLHLLYVCFFRNPYKNTLMSKEKSDHPQITAGTLYFKDDDQPSIFTTLS